MKINNKLITKDGKYPAKDVYYLDLTKLNILSFENLDQCQNLKHLLIGHNDLNCLLGLEKSSQLWRLDVNNNRVKNLDGLNKFVTFGTINLYSNEFNWNELEKIRHLHIVDLIIANNSKMSKDPYYRIHLIDCLPNVWMIDGLLVTSVERVEVNEFFAQSAKTSRPVRHKLSKYQFIPSDLKKRDIYGEWSTKLLTKFPVNGLMNVEMDNRRLEFIASWFEEIIFSECKYIKENHHANINRPSEKLSYFKDSFDDDKLNMKSSLSLPPIMNKNFLNDMLELRKKNSEMCNMILVLLVASLNFKIPHEFMKETLKYSNLDKINEKLETIKLFQLPFKCRLYICNLLLSAVKIDRDQNIDAGFYENLFQSLRNILIDLWFIANEIDSNTDETDIFENNSKNNNDVGYNISLKDSRALLSTEIIQLFCLIPSFYDFLPDNQGLINILTLSIGDVRIYQAVLNMIFDLRKKNKQSTEVCDEMSIFIGNLLKINARQLMNKKSKRKKSNTSSSFLSFSNTSPTLNNPIIPSISNNTNGINTNNNKNQQPCLTNIQPLSLSTNQKSPILPGSARQPQSDRLTDIITSTINSNTVDLSKTLNDIASSTQSKSNDLKNEDEHFKMKPSIDDLIMMERNKTGNIVRIETNKIVCVKLNDESTMNENSLILIDMMNYSWDDMQKCWKSVDSNIVENNGEIDIETIIKIPNSLSDTSSRSINTSNYHLHSFKSITLSSSRSKQAFSGNELVSNNLKSNNKNESINIMSLNLDSNSLREQTSNINSGRNSNRVINLSFESNNINSSNNYHVNRVHSSQPHLIRPTITSPTNNSINNSKSFPIGKLFRQTQSIMSRSKSSNCEKKNSNKKIHFALNTSSDETKSANNIFKNNERAEEVEMIASKSKNESFNENIDNKIRNNHSEIDNSIEPVNDEVSLSIEDENNNNIDGEDEEINYTESLNNSMEKNVNIKIELDAKTKNHFQENIDNILMTSSPNNLNTNTPVSSLSSLDQEMINPLTNGSITFQTTTNLPAAANTASAIYNHSNYSSYSSNLIRTNLMQTYDYLGHPVYDTHLIQNQNGTTPLTTPYAEDTKLLNNNLSTSGKKKIIKVQDCTDWLTISKPKNTFQVNKNSSNGESNLNSVRNIPNNTANTMIDNHLDPPQHYYANLNRINNLLNRRMPRANTNPRTPILTSPSSRAHLMYKGLRPNSITGRNDFNLISKKLEIKNLNRY